MAVVKLKAGETVLVAAVKPGEPEGPVDPGYGIDLGLGYVRPSHPIALPPVLPAPPTGPVDPAWGIDEDLGVLHPGGGPIIPPGQPVPPSPVEWEIKTAWTPVSGWIVVAVPTGNVATPSTTEQPTPSKRK